MNSPAQLAHQGVAVHVAYALQLALGFVFLLAASSKFRRPIAFATTVVQYQLVPRAAAGALAAATMVVEAFIALSFLTGWLLSVGLATAVATVCVFAVAVAINLRRGRDVPCGCFGHASERISWRGLLRLGLLLASCLALAFLAAANVRTPTPSSLSQVGVSSLVYVLNVAAIAAFGTVGGLWLLEARAVTLVLRHLGPVQSWPTSLHAPKSGTSMEAI